MTLPRIATLLAITLVLALVVAQVSPPDDLGRNFAGVIGLMMCAALITPWMLRNYHMGEALRALLIWGVIIVLVTLAYSYKKSLGF